MKIKIHAKYVPDFEMIIPVPKYRDAEEYIDEFIENMFADEYKYSVEWEVV